MAVATIACCSLTRAWQQRALSARVPLARSHAFGRSHARAERSQALRACVERTVIEAHADLRHTCASLLFDAGRNVKPVSTILGHADPAFT